MKINILGSIYNIKYVKDQTFMYNEDHTGECDYMNKEILISKSNDGEENNEVWQKETLLHELAHAFMHESGQADINDERHAELLGKFASFTLKSISPQ